MGLIDQVLEAVVALIIIFIFMSFILPSISQISGPYGILFSLLFIFFGNSCYFKNIETGGLKQ